MRTWVSNGSTKALLPLSKAYELSEFSGVRSFKSIAPWSSLNGYVVVLPTS